MSRPLLLLIDDSTEMGLIVSSLARRAGWDATVCVDAEAAWAALAIQRPDLVLLDVNLPGVSGLDWLRRVRAAPEGTDLLVALYTHWGLPADVAAGLEAGVDFVFDKDLASRPGDWQRRLVEIREFRRKGKTWRAWPNADSSAMIRKRTRPLPPLPEWAAAFNQALRLPLLRRLTCEVAPVVMRRALTQSLGTAIVPPAFDAWISPHGLDPESLPPSLAPASPVHLAACLAEQIERLLGDEAGAAFRAALSAVPDLREFLSWP